MLRLRKTRRRGMSSRDLRRPTGYAIGVLVLVALVVTGPGATATTGGAVTHTGLPVLSTFVAKAQFPEGLAVDRAGNLYVSVTTWGKTEKDPNTGRVWKIAPTGRRTAFGPTLQLGGGLLTGVAVDARDRVYVAHAAYDKLTRPGVWRLDHGVLSRLVDLRAGGFPNGLAFHGGSLYVSDSALGTIWRIRGAGHASLWTHDRLLAPGKRGLGANGIAFAQNRLYVAVTDAGRIVGIPLAANGEARKAATVVKSKKLVGADGLTVDAQGVLYVVSDMNNLVLRLRPGGQLEQLANRASGLRYPTSLAFGRRAADKNVLYIVNGDYFGTATPNLVSFELQALPAA